MRPEGAQIVLARSSGDPNVLCGKACAQRGAAGRTVVFQALRDIGTRLDSCLGFVTDTDRRRRLSFLPLSNHTAKPHVACRCIDRLGMTRGRAIAAAVARRT